MQSYGLQLESILSMLACVPQGPLLLWSALEGLGWLSSLAGEAYPQAETCFQDNWDTVDSSSEEQATVFSPNTLSTLVRLHVTPGYSR